MATVRELEAKILEIEEVVVVIRAAADTEVGEYRYERKAAGSTSVSDWGDQRLKPLLNGLDFMIVNGSYTHPHGRTKMETLRNGYSN